MTSKLSHAAANRLRALVDGRDLPAEEMARLRRAARLTAVLEKVTAALYDDPTNLELNDRVLSLSRQVDKLLSRRTENAESPVYLGAASTDKPLLAFLDDLTLENGEPLGANLDPWQREDFEALAGDIPCVYLGRARAHSKTADLAAVGLHHILTTPGARAYAFAVDEQQASLIQDSVAGFVRRSPDLQSRVQVLKRSISAPKTDSRLEIWSADAASSWGLRPSLVILDELSNWVGDGAEQLYESLFSATGKVKGCRFLIGTTAGWDRNSLAWRVRESAQQSKYWHFTERGNVASWLTEEWLNQMREGMPAHRFEMLHQNVWTRGGAEFLTWAEVDGIFEEGLQQQTDYIPGANSRAFIGLDIGLVDDRTALAIVRVENGPRAVVANIVTWQGSREQRVNLQEVEDTVVEMAKKYHISEIVCDPTEGRQMADRLRAKGLKVEEYKFTSASRPALFQDLLTMIRQQQLKSYEHDLLREELNGMRWTARNGQLRPDHRPGAHDDVVIAVALAAGRALANATRPPQEVRARRLDGNGRATYFGYGEPGRRVRARLAKEAEDEARKNPPTPTVGPQRTEPAYWSEAKRKREEAAAKARS